jgi:hypothetical protein
MSTLYEAINDRFLSKVNDYELAELLDADLETELLKFLKGAISDFKYCTKDLSDRDDVGKTFNISLTDLEQEILAKFMIIHWINPFVFRQENLQNHFSTKDFKLYSPSGFLDKLVTTRKEMINEANSDMVHYYYAT